MKSLDFDMLNWIEAQYANSTKVYINGQDLYAAIGEPDFIELYSALNLENTYLNEGRTLNLTLTVLSSSIS